jgi:ABC-type lipoprotein release transport system permease subunit
MKVPFSYIFRNLWTRKLTTILTASGMGLVVFVFAAVLMLDAGLKQTMVGTGTLDNVLAIRTGSETEIQSGITRDQAGLLEAMPQVARSKTGEPLISKETLVLISLVKSGQEKGSNVIVRGQTGAGSNVPPWSVGTRGRPEH